jgi:hypothetical protein
LIPRAPVCQARSSAQSCQCANKVFVQGGRNNYQCGCLTNQTTVVPATNTTNATTTTSVVSLTQNLIPQQCGCLAVQNENSTANLCNCCVQAPLTCPAALNAQIQSCQCVTAANGAQNCSCTRMDTNIGGQFVFNSTLCVVNAADQTAQCCVTPAQQATQVPVLTCPVSNQKQGCQCSIDAFKNLSCNCLRNDNGIRGTFEFSQ